jgi:hypothetical protein
MMAFCPYCKKKVAVYTELAEEDALRLLSQNKPIAVMHVGPDGDHIWLARKDRGDSPDKSA